MTAARVVLWRHGETDYNVVGRFQGQSDVPLNARGIAQARRSAPHIAALGVTRIVSSDLSRARTTAAALVELTELPLEIDPRLREINVGEWEGLVAEDIQRLDPDFYPAVTSGHDHRRSPTGETATEAGCRCALGLLDLAESTPDGGVLVAVGHGLAYRVATFLLMGLGFNESMRVGSMSNCAWNVLRPVGDHWRLLSFNNTAAEVVL